MLRAEPSDGSVQQNPCQQPADQALFGLGGILQLESRVTVSYFLRVWVRGKNLPFRAGSFSAAHGSQGCSLGFKGKA